MFCTDIRTEYSVWTHVRRGVWIVWRCAAPAPVQDVIPTTGRQLIDYLLSFAERGKGKPQVSINLHLHLHLGRLQAAATRGFGVGEKKVKRTLGLIWIFK